MKVKVTITTREAIELIVTSEFHTNNDGKRVAYNNGWTITHDHASFYFEHDLSTEGHQDFNLVDA